MASTPEAKMKKKVDAVLKEFGIWFFAPQSGIYGRSGIPDRIACVKGLMVGIEVKASPKQKPTALQDKTMEDMMLAGAVCFVVDDEESLEGLRTWLKMDLATC